MYPILEKEFLSSTVARFVIKAPFIAPKRKPGNFVIVRVIETGEPLHLSFRESAKPHAFSSPKSPETL